MTEKNPPGTSNDKPAETPAELSTIIIDEQHTLTLTELSHACAVQSGYIVELVDEGLLTPETVDEHEPHRWRFTGTQMRRARVASRLQNDLGINLAGVALALQLLEEVEVLRARLEAMDRE
ncbi:chaperone modulator CbpM [Nitrosovibrio sp. Nv4]|uniref:chaperone modulator CbpM n=1 Tax=Nitrosovibrio sp. Nv4 TaxID=1945880 RepID=UPI000BD8A2D1|nr:chaperone modulator CbpM [Nitrosovibrio sp. Nv4]SOD41786.1 chaperone modulatory protein CbpM [Nitrosovibrio sp. Nv4]